MREVAKAIGVSTGKAIGAAIAYGEYQADAAFKLLFQ